MASYCWPADICDVTYRLWGEGYSAGEISYMLGRWHKFHVSRSAVMGRISRERANGHMPLELARVRAPTVKPKPAARSKRPRQGFQFKTAPVPVPVYDFVCRATRLPYQWVHDTMPRWRHENGCRYIEGSPDTCREGGFCNRPIMRGSKSWCPEHYRLVWEARRGGSPRPKFRSKYSVFPVVDGTVLVLDE